MTLLSRECFYTGMDLQRDNDTGKHERFMLAAVSRLLLPSNYGRDALCVDLVSPTMPSTVLRLLNVHLDSLGDMKHYRAQQMTLLADMLREPGCSGGLIAGDFNAISAADDKLINDNGLVDAWIALRGVAGSAGNTWGAGIHKQDGPKRKRLDKVALMGLTALDMKVIRPGLLQVPIACGRFYKVPWSDHCGLTCNFSL
ncbi:hypothetical protein QQS21_002068 [Conoideocrella luteorostrata]|uniref:Endonuclease/exonuclease/phosphatase domain-containing protein n=1 Tax=Conoideocrella luteorostrata TaxID=1105319 RepID=A0AAJ0CZX0_9HYPO|nr:hypothetical protein QQS21_002068 [Conoideocrella luteorostrata]